MLTKKMLAGTNGIAVTSNEARSYETSGKRMPSIPAISLDTQRNYLPGLRRVEIDFEAYFKDAYYGQTF